METVIRQCASLWEKAEHFEGTFGPATLVATQINRKRAFRHRIVLSAADPAMEAASLASPAMETAPPVMSQVASPVVEDELGLSTVELVGFGWARRSLCSSSATPWASPVMEDERGLSSRGAGRGEGVGQWSGVWVSVGAPELKSRSVDLDLDVTCAYPHPPPLLFFSCSPLLFFGFLGRSGDPICT